MNQTTGKVLLKNMVCPRCIRVVREDLAALNLPVERVEMGAVWLTKPLNKEQEKAMQEVLEANGFEVLNNREKILVAQVKQLIIQHVWGREKKPVNLNFSDYLAQKTFSNYSHLSRLFSTWTSTTIEQFIIQTKIERAKELLIYDEETLSEISWQIGYSSPQYLSAQFKKVTGMTPTKFKNLIVTQRNKIQGKQ